MQCILLNMLYVIMSLAHIIADYYCRMVNGVFFLLFGKFKHAHTLSDVLML